MKTLRPIASPRVLTRALNTELQESKQRSDTASPARRYYRIITVITVVLLAVSAAWLPVPVFAQLPNALREGLDNQKAGRLKEAIEIYTEVIAKNPRSAEAYNWRGMAEEDLGQLDQALADYNKAIAIAPDYADAYNNRGEVYRKKNMIPQATGDFRKATQLDRSFAEAYYNIGLMYELQKRAAPAVQEYENYLKFKPDAPDKQQVQDKIEALKKMPGFKAASPATAAKKPGERPGAARPLPGKKPGEAPAVPKPLPQKKVGEAPPVAKHLAQKKPGERPGLPKPGMPMKPVTPPGGIDLGIPGVPPIPMNPDMLMAMAAGTGLIGLIISVISYLFPAIMLFLIARKTNTNLSWLAFIPIANLILALRVAGKPIWWLLLFLLPVVSVAAPLLEGVIPTGGMLPLAVGLLCLLAATVAALLVCLGIARARGKSPIWGVLLFIPCTSIIALAYLGLSK
jgi:tetratricopeptide (TPR) repeat protein